MVMKPHLYWLARVLWPDLMDIAYDEQVGYVLRFPNPWGNPCPQVRIGGSRGDWQFIWHWLVDQVTFRGLSMLAKVLV